MLRFLLFNFINNSLGIHEGDAFCNTDRDLSRHSRNRRYLESDQKWNGDKITYSILNFTPRLGRNLTRKAIKSAISHWKKYLAIPIVEIEDEQWMDSADIRIKFVNSSHGDNSPFDGPGNYLAHAFYPGPGLGGDTHFDAEEPWIYRDHPEKKGNDLFLVSIHELGHALGLAHSTDPSSIMFATYQSHNTENFQLPMDDILGIHKIYGKKPSTMLNSTALMYKPKESFKTDSSMDESIRVRMCMERIVGVVDTDEELVIFSEKRFSVLYRDYSSDEFLRLNSSQSELLVSVPQRWTRQRQISSVVYEKAQRLFIFLSQNILSVYEGRRFAFETEMSTVHVDAQKCTSLFISPVDTVTGSSMTIKILCENYRVFGLKLSNNAILEVGEEDPSRFVDIFPDSIDSIEASWEGRCIEPSRQTDRCFHYILDGNYFSTSRENKLVALSNSPGFFKAVFLNCSLLNLYWEKYTQFILAFLCLLCAFLLGLLLALLKLRRTFSQPSSAKNQLL